MPWKEGGLTKCGQRGPGCLIGSIWATEGWQDGVVSRVIKANC